MAGDDDEINEDDDDENVRLPRHPGICHRVSDMFWCVDVEARRSWLVP